MDHPNIPVSHYFSELKRAMEDTVELIESEIDDEDVTDHLKKCADLSRPWAYIYLGLQLHDFQLDWLKAWCSNSIPLLPSSK